MLEIHYLYHSGFAVIYDKYCFIFDYYLDTPRGCGLSKGVINPSEIRDKEVFVFVSHRHPDHYNRRIYSWRKDIPHIHYIVSDDIKTTENVHFIRGGMKVNIGAIEIRALTSTDFGVAFIVKTDSVCIYHAGDLNWWHWEGEPEQNNRNMEMRYKQQIDSLKGERIDIAFVPVDPRLGKHALWGLTYLMQTADVNFAVPMHFGGDTSIFQRIESDKQVNIYRDRLIFMQKRGDTVVL